MNLFAGPYDHEFGHELFSFQGHVRYLSKKYDKVAVCSKPSMEFLYQDFVDTFVPLGEDLSKYEDYHKVTKEDCHNHVSAGAGNVNLEQEFVSYGNKSSGQGYDIIFHARTKEWGMCKNLENDVYDLVANELNKNYKVAFMGTKDASYCPSGIEDLRNKPLNNLADDIASSSLVVGQSSGPIHFASLCRTPHLTWGGYRLRTFARYTHHWNPFKTPCYLYEAGEGTGQENYISNRIRSGARVPRDILEKGHVNIIKIKNYREPREEDLLHSINNILNKK